MEKQSQTWNDEQGRARAAESPAERVSQRNLRALEGRPQAGDCIRHGAAARGQEGTAGGPGAEATWVLVEAQTEERRLFPYDKCMNIRNRCTSMLL